MNSDRNTTPHAGTEAPKANAVAAGFSTADLRALLALIDADDAFDAKLRALFERRSARPLEARGKDDPNVEPRLIYGLLRAISDDAHGSRWWQGLAEDASDDDGKVMAREEAVLRLWRRLEGDERGRAYVRNTYRSLRYNRHRLFDWLLGRYDLARARALWLAHGRWPLRHLCWLLLAAVLAVLALGIPPAAARPKLPLYTVLTIYAAAVLVPAAAFRRRAAGVLEAAAIAGQCLAPRLAAASIVGLVILASSQELLGFVAGGASAPRFFALAAGGALYLGLEIFRRIRPFPDPMRLLRLSADIAALGFAHSLAMAVVAAPGLQSILGAPAPLDRVQLLNVAAFLFAIGLIVNLIWAEEAVTQPL